MINGIMGIVGQKANYIVNSFGIRLIETVSEM